MSEQTFYTDKNKVAQSFGAAAMHYEKVAVLQKLVAERLLERLGVVKIRPDRVLDLGAGTGRLANGMKKKYRGAKLLQLDLALDMLRYSKNRTTGLFNKQAFLCADAEQIPVADNSIDLVCSNLMLQWCNDIDAVFAHVNRALKPEGLFMFSTFGPDTLIELRNSWAVADDGVHVNNFIDMHDIGDALVRAGFEQPVMEVETFTLTYDDVRALMVDLKQLGAHNVSQGRRRSMTGKNKLKTMQSAYEALRVEGKLPATFEVVYGHAWMPSHQTSRNLDERTAVFPVSALTQKNSSISKGRMS